MTEAFASEVDDGADSDVETESVFASEVDDVMVLDEVSDPELVLAVWEPTGEPRVDAALDALSALDSFDVSGHAEIFTEVHGGLRQVLADLDSDRL